MGTSAVVWPGIAPPSGGFFKSLWMGEKPSPPLLSPSVSTEILRVSGRENCKADILLREMGFFAARYPERPPHMTQGAIEVDMVEPISNSYGGF